jgi:Ca2+-binding RTX toxin-like protein
MQFIERRTRGGRMDMATQTIENDFDSAIDVLAAADVLIINKGVVGRVDGTAINAASQADDRVFDIRGRVITRGDDDCLVLGLSGFGAGTSDTTIDIGRKGRLEAGDGTAISIFAQDTALTNKGILFGENGIAGNMFGGFLDNQGTIRAERHCLFNDSENLDVLNTGLMQSEKKAAIVLKGDSNVLLNQGVIQGPENGAAIVFGSDDGDSNVMSIQGDLLSDDIAFRGGLGEEFVNVSGRVVGDVLLGGGNDVFEISGIIDGIVRGGDGSDQYLIGKTKIEIRETADGGEEDAVLAASSTALDKFIEFLDLDGSGNIDGTGNNQANTIFGNSGENVIRGLGGADELTGFQGNDKLFGGNGKDELVFLDTGDRDSAMDFVPGEDIARINSFNLTPFTQVETLLFDVAGGVELRIGDDVVFFKDLKKNDLDNDDFIL